MRRKHGCRAIDGGALMKEIVRLENVIKMVSAGRREVNDVSMSIHEKERVVIYGVPGSGKGMVMRLIAGMEKPSAGEVIVMDKEVHEMDADTAADFRNQNIGIMQREPGLMERLTILENVELPLTVQGIRISQRTKAVKEQLKTLGISHVANAYPAQLSTYEAQMVSVARALITQPKILLLDEITADLSAKETEQIMGIIHAVWKFGGYTIVGFSGAKSSALRADRYIQLDHGKVSEDKL